MAKNNRITPILLAIFFMGLWLLLPGYLSAAEEGVVRGIEIRGNKRVETATILYYIKTQVGKPLVRTQIRRDIEEIYNLGQFKDIRVETEKIADGVKVIFLVEEISIVGEVKIFGNDEIDSKDILDKVGLKRGAPFNPNLLQENTAEITRLYHDKGYFLVNVKIDIVNTKENQVEAVINIAEGEKIKIDKINFSGNKNVSSKALHKAMETKEKSWYSWIDDSGIYKKDVLKIDLLRIESHYHDNGYVKVRVLEPRIDINKTAKKINITIPVEEGEQYKVGKIVLADDDTFTALELRKAIKVKEGETYNMSQIREDVLSLTELYSERGYAYADVSPLTNINDAAKTVDLDIKTNRGRKVYIGEIRLQGNTRTLDHVIRREFRLREGEQFDSKKLKRTKQRINNTQFFEDVKIDTKPGKTPDHVDIETTVTERPTGAFTLGAGYSSVENVILTASISQDNIFGRGQKLILATELSSRRSNVNLSFSDPHLFDSDITGGFDLFNRRTNFFSFLSRNTGGGVRLGKNINEYDWAGLSYRFENVEVSNVDAASANAFLYNGERTTSRIVPSFTHDTRDDFLNPTTGLRHTVRLDLGGLGGLKFYRANYDFTYYHPLIGKFVGAFHGDVNIASGYAGDTLPIFERYFLGGPNTLRGYTIRDVGPKDLTGNPIGGTQSLLFNVELLYPITKSFRGFLFYDRGNAYGDGPVASRTARSIDFAEMRSSVGAGVRFISPFGPIGFSYGVKLDHDPADQHRLGEFHFSAGNAF